MGLNGSGQIGDGTGISRSIPTQVLGSGAWKILGDNGSSTSIFNAGIKNDNTLWLWGNGNYIAQNSSVSNKSSPVQIYGGGTWTDVAQTYRTGAAVKSDGTLWTWGDNYWGAIGRYGLAYNTFVYSPVQTTLGGSTWSKAAGGYGQVFAIKTDGTLWAWGANGGGTLGLGFVGGQGYGGMFSPVQVGTDTTWKMVGSLYAGGIAIKQDNTLWIWGNNNNGQLGQGNIINRSSPVQVGTGTDWAFVPKTASGITSSAFAIKNDGSLWGWGGNSNGQLAQNNTADRSSPVQITGTWSKVTYTRSVIGLKTDGSLWAWGHNSYGTIGDNTKIHRSSPVQTTLADTKWINVVGFGGIRATTTSTTTTSTTTTSTTSTSTTSTTSTTQAPGALYTWGYRNLGSSGDNNDTVIYQSPTQIIDASQYRDLPPNTSGYGSCFAIKPDGTLWAWGLNAYYGALGDGTLENRSSPIQITSNTWNMVSSSSLATLAIKSDNTLWGWGGGAFLPNNSNTSYSSPIQIGTDTWRYVNTGGQTGAGIKTDGTLWLWGRNQNGQLGNNQVSYNTQSSPTQTVAGGNNWIFVNVSSDGFVHAIKSDTNLWAWGNNSWGQIGNNTSYVSYSSPIQIGASGWAYVSSTKYHVLAVKTNGTLWAWGYNAYGILGLNTDNLYSGVSSPIQVGTDTNWKKSAALDYSSAATKTDGTLWAWGSNYYNQTGNPYAGYALSSPIQTLANDNLWIDISGNIYGVYATRSAGYVATTPSPTTSTTTTTPQPGSLLGMGFNFYGQIGNNTTNSQSFPTQEITNSSWSKLPSGSYLYSAYVGMGGIKTDGTLWTWGYIWDSGSIVHRSSPVQISTGGTWTDFSISSYSVNAVKSNGTLWAWGQLPGNSNNSSPTQIGTDTDWKYVFKNSYVSAAIKNDDTAYLWGSDVSYGLFGDNTATNSSKLIPTQTITGSWNMIVGGNAMFGIKTDGTLWSWGYNAYGRLGLNDTINRSSPTQISGSYTYVSSDGYSVYMAVKSDGTLWGWGNGECVINAIAFNGGPYNYQGYSSPVQLFSSTGWTKVLGSDDNSIALKSDGTAWTWGYNRYGLAGNGKLVPFYATTFSPVQVNYTGWSDIYSNRDTNFGLFN
jgi:alpha-tubulin suppressor-like RCC1 family protein